MSLYIHSSSFPACHFNTDFSSDILLVIHHSKAHNHLQGVVFLTEDHLQGVTYVDVEEEGQVGGLSDEIFQKDLEY